jgi:hypothetical protein
MWYTMREVVVIATTNRYDRYETDKPNKQPNKPIFHIHSCIWVCAIARAHLHTEIEIGGIVVLSMIIDISGNTVLKKCLLGYFFGKIKGSLNRKSQSALSA